MAELSSNSGATHAPAGVNTALTTTRTDLDDLQSRLQAWLQRRTGDDTATVENLDRSTASGMSSVSVLFTAIRGCSRTEYVLRLAPEPSALPVFPDYDLRRQTAVANAVADAGRVPVPRVCWVEESPGPLGRPFLVMERAFGSAPPDNPPYVFGGPLTEATPLQLDATQHASVEVLVGVHATPSPERIEGMPSRAAGPNDLTRFVEETADYYEWAIAGGVRVPLLEEGLSRLRRELPGAPSKSVLTWGDARIGNILYRDLAPCAVLDWEGATLAPPELDVAWFVFFHRMYQDMAESFGKPGLPGFLRPADVLEQYQQSSGRTLEDIHYYLLLAAVRMGVIFARIKRRSVHFGDVAQPPTPDEYVLHHRMLRAILDNRYQWEA